MECIIKNHSSTKEFNREKRANLEETQASASLLDPANLDEDEDDILNTANLMEEDEEANTSLDLPPLAIELKTFLGMPPVPEKHKVDVLAWWKKNGSNMPLLSQIARDILAIPMASSSSERVFSAGGSIVTDKRHNLATESVKKLLLVKVNYDKVKSSLKMKYVSTEEQLVDPPPPPKSPKKTPKKTPQKKAAIQALKAKRQTSIPFKRRLDSTTTVTSGSSTPTPGSTTDSSENPENSPKPSTSAAATRKRQIPVEDSSSDSDIIPESEAVYSEKRKRKLGPVQLKKRQKLSQQEVQEVMEADWDDEEEYIPSEEY